MTTFSINHYYLYSNVLSVTALIVNDTHREILCFIQFSTRMAAWLLLTFFICLYNQLNSEHSIITYLKSADV